MNIEAVVGIVGIGVSVIASFIGALFALWYQSQGFPRLEILPDNPSDGDRMGGFRAKFIKIKVLNQPRKWPFLKREAAHLCHGEIIFTNSKGEHIGKKIPIRWDDAPEPYRYQVQGDRLVTVPEPSLVGNGRYTTIPPGQTKSCAIAVRIHGDAEAYGWTIDSYFYEKWRNPNVQLSNGEFFVLVKIVSDDKEVERKIRIFNSDTYEDFDLEAQRVF